MTDLAKLVVKLEAQTAQYQRQLERAQKQNQTFGEKAKRHFGSAKAAYLGFAGAVAGAFATVANGIERQADLFDLSTRLGATTRGLSQLQYAAQQSGVSVQTLNMGLQRMVRRVAEAANGTGEARGALEELNIEATALNQLRPEEQFRVLADAIMKVENPADRVRLAMKLFDSEGVSLIQTMQGGSAALQAFAEESDRLGTTIDDSAAAASKRASDAFTRLAGVFTGVSNTMAGQFAPEMEAIADFMTENLPAAANIVRKAFLVIQRGFVNLALQAVNVRIKFNELTRDFEEADRLRATADLLRQMVSDIGGQAAAVGTTTKSVGDYRSELDTTRYATENFSIATSKAAQEVETLSQKASKAASEIPAFWQEAQESFEVAEDMLTQPVANNDNSVMDRFFGESSMRSLFSDFENIEQRFKMLLARMAAEAIAANIVNAITGGTSGGGFGNIFGNLFGGARAMGGPVNPSSAYMVGERGPELFVPSTSGNIVPNHQMAANGEGVQINNYIGEREIESLLNSAVAGRAIMNRIKMEQASIRALVT
ncbi:MAG: hypothetical protein AAF756_20560 [Pseudomonadota bacterium]